jgi:hypothetical protein
LPFIICRYILHEPHLVEKSVLRNFRLKRKSLKIANNAEMVRDRIKGTINH